MKRDEWNVTESKYVDNEISRYRPEGLSAAQTDGLKAIRATLRAVSSRLPGFCFKSYVRGNVVWIVMMRANHGTQETVSSAKVKLDILTDALTMPSEVFQERLEKFLRENGFEIG